ncbi:phosphotransferase [Spectribacter hydrogenooxidans]|uniref:Phosphotransferase n=1 Tax=Spectribacter hydrogenoxidans TaxID=3075608 RepID=A0ABU3C381_9GAMM|nr:phosphotransferase [Salinisphaera sp. W335]MDT0636001.1 phosphotransferase [Salinisphaera sp. W335]
MLAEVLPIVSPEEVTPEWMTAALHRNGIDATVASLDMEAVGTGQLGETRRYFIHYRGTPPPAAPASLVGKFPSADKTAADSGKNMGFYRSELMFYRELAHQTDIRTPDVYVAELDDDNDFVLLLEDLAPAWCGDQMRGCSVEEARKALVEAALLHAAFWNDRELMNQDWCYVPEGAQGFYTTELIEQSWDHVRKTYDGQLSPEVMDVCAKFVRNHAWWNRPRDFPKCFSHNDFRPDNMLFGGADGRVAVVDWQTSNFLGTGMDPAYFLGAIFDRETRRANERPLLQAYHDQLVHHGVTDYSFDHLLRDYAHYSFAQIAVAMTATMIVKRTDRGDRLFMHMITGAALQALDNNALDDLPD